MLKSCLAGLLVGLLSFGASYQIVCALGSGASAWKPSANQRPTSDAMQLAGRLNVAVKTICASSCPEVMMFRNETAANAMLVAEGSQAKLVYSPQFFASAHDSFGDAGIIAIIAHELGHALDDAMGAAWIQSKWTPELRADAWAGCALAHCGLSPSDREAAFGALEKYPSPAHPAWNVRLPAIRAGYTGCGGNNRK
jgi:hypothetical protein